MQGARDAFPALSALLPETVWSCPLQLNSCDVIHCLPWIRGEFEILRGRNLKFDVFLAKFIKMAVSNHIKMQSSQKLIYCETYACI